MVGGLCGTSTMCGRRSSTAYHDIFKLVVDILINIISSSIRYFQAGGDEYSAN